MLQIPNRTKKDLKLVETKLGYYAHKTEDILPDVRGLILRGGKRIRPSILLLSYRLLKGRKGNKTLKTALDSATVVELLHAASLLHDDVIEGAKLRRGAKTINDSMGDKAAVLVGDLLSTFSSKLLSETQNIEIVRLISGASALICEGEIEDVLNSYNVHISKERYIRLVMKKTAVLFEACSELGGMAAGAGPAEIRALRKYGANLGIAFQIVDDILDYTAEAREFGKPVLSDLAEGKITLPIIYALKKAGRADRKRIIRTVAGLKQKKRATEAVMREVKAVLERYNCIRLSYKTASEYAERAVRSLRKLPDNEFKQALTEITAFVISREY